LSWLFRSSLLFSKLREVDFTGQLLQDLDETFGAHTLEDAPFGVRDRDHHPIVGTLQMARQVITGYGIGDLLFTVHTESEKRVKRGQAQLTAYSMNEVA
jgi:hypothetical protein